MEYAREAAVEHGALKVTTEHIAEGLVKLAQGVHWTVWEKLGLDIDSFREANLKNLMVTTKEKWHSPNNIPFSKEVETLDKLAQRSAKTLCQRSLKTSQQGSNENQPL